MANREVMEYDVVVVGCGPAGLATAIRLRQLSEKLGNPLNVCILEKGSEPGAHSLAGAVLEPRALNELLPDWQGTDAPIKTPVISDKFCFLTKNSSFSLPTPPAMKNEGNYIISISRLVRWLAAQAEGMGVEIYPGFAAAEVLYDESGKKVVGIATGDMGIDKDGNQTANYQPGVEIRARYTVLAEGCRGSLSGELISRFDLQSGKSPQTYGIGIKELWETPQAVPGTVLHTVGWPLSNDTYGGSFVYHLEENKIALGFVVGLDYKNPYLSPYQEFQRFKHHPFIAPLLEKGRRIGYGARALNEGGWQSIPQLVFPGGLLVGCSAGFLNVPKIKGIHTAMKSGMLAAESIIDSWQKEEATITSYPDAIANSWIKQELYKARNIRPGFAKGFWLGMINAAIDTYIFRGRAPWTFTHHADHQQLKLAADCTPIDYPKPDGVISFSRLDNLSFAGVNHEANQPAHLKLRDPNVAVAVNWQQYAGPEARFCPAGVYEFVEEKDKGMSLVINAQNCVHCKTCDIKDYQQNIHWVTPEGGGGPNYEAM